MPDAPVQRNTRRAIVRLLKSEGAMDAAQLAEKLDLTAMAVRQHLYGLEREKLIESESHPVPLGRPKKYWRLTRAADRLFPDAYAELSVALIEAMGKTFGPEGLKRVLESRCTRQQADYGGRIPRSLPLKDKLRHLARIRTEEGYMAEVKPGGGGGWLLVENHCPICAAATACQGFCATELDLFRSVLGPDVEIAREEHIVSGGRRCAYRIAQSARNMTNAST